MSDFFKQLLTQIRDIWVRFNTLQKVVLVSVFAITFFGLVISVSITSFGEGKNGRVTLFTNLALEDAADITGFLREAKYEYELEDDGRTLTVSREAVHEARMELAKAGLPRQAGKGYELFDEAQFGMTDFVQNLNFKRATEVELIRSIETLREVDKARIHVSIAKATLFTEKKEENSASVILKIQAGQELLPRQIKGITHLVASAVAGLKARQVTILDTRGNMLTRGFAEDAISERTNHNMELQRGVEKHLEGKVRNILEGVLGPNKARIKVSAELDFDQVNRTVESFDPQKKVVRSEQREDGTRKNSPATGDEVKEGSITNYEMDRSVASIIKAPGTRKRISVSVAVDGSYEMNDKGEREYKPRSPEEMDVIRDLVRSAVGYSKERKDDIFVASVRFDNSYLQEEATAMEEMTRWDLAEVWGGRLLILLIIGLGFIFLRSVVRNISDAMNPPIPRYAGIDLEIQEEAIPEHVKRQNEILDRMEEMTRDDPVNMADLIRTWLLEGEKKDD